MTKSHKDVDSGNSLKSQSKYSTNKQEQSVTKGSEAKKSGTVVHGYEQKIPQMSRILKHKHIFVDEDEEVEQVGQQDAQVIKQILESEKLI